MSQNNLTGCTPWNPIESTGGYNYDPSLGAGIVFSILFAASFIGHVYQAYVKKTWWTLVFAVGAMTELMGWIGRSYSAECPYNLQAFIMQICVLCLAPAFFAAGIYIILGCLIKLMGPQTSPIKPNTYLWIFCGCDLLSLIIQSIGGAMASIAAANGYSTSKTGTSIMVGGIDFQMASITVFIGFFVVFLRRANKTRTALPRRVKWLIAATAFSCLMIYIRSIYRTVELLQGWSGYLLRHQPYFIVFDACLMWLAVAVFNVVHPGWFLPYEVDNDAARPEMPARNSAGFSSDEIEKPTTV